MGEGPFCHEDVAANYEAWYDTPEGRRADELEKALLAWLLQRATKPASSVSVLEIGCGTGHFTRWLRDEGLMAVGLDLSAAMLAEARALDGVPLVLADARSLPFPNGTFDLTVLITTLEFLARPREALQEARRVARRGLVLGVLNRWSLLGLKRWLVGLLRQTVYDAAHFYTVGELMRLLRTAAGSKDHIEWRTTLFPRGCPWSQARLPWGGFIGMALIIKDRLPNGRERAGRRST